MRYERKRRGGGSTDGTLDALSPPPCASCFIPHYSRPLTFVLVCRLKGGGRKAASPPETSHSPLFFSFFSSTPLRRHTRDAAHCGCQQRARERAAHYYHPDFSLSGVPPPAAEAVRAPPCARDGAKKKKKMEAFVPGKNLRPYPHPPPPPPMLHESRPGMKGAARRRQKSRQANEERRISLRWYTSSTGPKSGG